MHKHLAALGLALILAGCTPPMPPLNPIANPKLPGQVLNLNGWTLTTPLPDRKYGALEIKTPALSSYRANFFHTAADGNSVTAITPTDGAVQVGAEFPRTELRNNTLWSALQGRHHLTATVSIDAIPTAGKRTQVVGQVHALGPYILLIQLDRNLLYVKAGDRNIATLNSDYQLGAIFTYEFVVTAGVITVYYNGNQAVTWQTDCTECYFKAGSYLQIPPNNSTEFGQVSIFALNAESNSEEVP